MLAGTRGDPDANRAASGLEGAAPARIRQGCCGTGRRRSPEFPRGRRPCCRAWQRRPSPSPAP